MKTKMVILMLTLTSIKFITQANAATDQDINKLTTYAVMLGRAIGCGIDTENEATSIGEWMDERFPPGSNDQQIYLPILMDGVKMHMEQQQNGQSPDSCDTVRTSFSNMSFD